MGLLTRRGFYLAILLGALAATFAWRQRRDPCRQLARIYAGIYDDSRGCRSDAECVLDPPPPAGPVLCDRARARTRPRDRLVEIERTFEVTRCSLGAERCPPMAGARCVAGRCTAQPGG
jgi:hypothetical protein